MISRSRFALVGGGSFNSGDNQESAEGNRDGDGLVIITRLP